MATTLQTMKKKLHQKLMTVNFKLRTNEYQSERTARAFISIYAQFILPAAVVFSERPLLTPRNQMVLGLYSHFNPISIEICELIKPAGVVLTCVQCELCLSQLLLATATT
uniref:Uncharacterized protein n=1 Tax=Glossina palpalis gambiensis TaxID=67801 RepID=A0A1B0AYS0_9MUSC